MKKKSKLSFYISLFSILLLLSFVYASINPSKTTYNTGETIRVTNTNSELCPNLDPKPDTVNLYIVNDKDSWSEGDPLIDVRDEPSEVPNTRFTLREIWKNPDPGDYDIIVDCVENEEYNVLEPLFNGNLSVIPKKGTGRIFDGTRDISNFTWQYDSEQLDPVNEILHLRLSAEDENIELNNILLEFESPENSTTNLEIYIDKNNNGRLNPVDVLIGNLETSEKTGNISLNYTLNQGIDESLLLTYNMNKDYEIGAYSLKITSLFGKGVASDDEIRFFGVPRISNSMNVISQKTCLGSLKLTLTPNPAEENAAITARINNLTGCDNKKVSLRTNPCFITLKKEVGFCVLENNNCELTFDSIKGKYHACIDKNDDGDFIDFGEFDSDDLAIKSDEIPEETEEPEQTSNESKVNGETNEGETSKSKNPFLDGSNPLLVLLEVTLLLILFVLILILMNLRGNFSEDSEITEKPIEDELSESKTEEPIDLAEEVEEEKEETKEPFDEPENVEEKQEDNIDETEKKESKKKKK